VSRKRRSARRRIEQIIQAVDRGLAADVLRNFGSLSAEIEDPNARTRTGYLGPYVRMRGFDAKRRRWWVTVGRRR
jgi:hypothetical protein